MRLITFAILLDLVSLFQATFILASKTYNFWYTLRITNINKRGKFLLFVTNTLAYVSKELIAKKSLIALSLLEGVANDERFLSLVNVIQIFIANC